MAVRSVNLILAALALGILCNRFPKWGPVIGASCGGIYGGMMGSGFTDLIEYKARAVEFFNAIPMAWLWALVGAVLFAGLMIMFGLILGGIGRVMHAEKESLFYPLQQVLKAVWDWMTPVKIILVLLIMTILFLGFGWKLIRKDEMKV